MWETASRHVSPALERALPAHPEGDDMDCCGRALTRRSYMWGTLLTSFCAMLGGGGGPRGSTAAAQTPATASAALDVLRKSISVDVHTHGLRTACARDRWRSRASPTCRMVPYLEEMRPA